MIREGRIAEGEARLRQALALLPAHHEARLALARLLIQQGRLEHSREILRDGLRLAPRHLPYARLLARILVETGASDQALMVLEDVRLAGADDPEYLAFLAQLYQRGGRHEQAVATYTQALSLAPQTGRWWLGLGISYEALGQAAPALQAYRRARLNGALDDALRQFVERRILALRAAPPAGDR